MNSPRKESTILRNKDELMSLKRAMTDIFYFVQFIYIIHPIRGKVRFDLYPFQKAVIWQFLTNQFNIVLKFRQAGITELIALYCLWLALYKENQNIVIISIKDKVAKKVLRRIKYMYKHLPSYLKVRVVNGVSHKLGTCVTPDTVIVGEKEDFELGKYIPYQVGTLNVEHLGLRVLTHKGTFERVIKTYNKGVLETWEIQDDFGNLLKCTPEHRLYTTKGWKSVRDVVKGNLDIITWDTSYFDGLESPETLKPKKEVIKETGYPGYLVSNMGNVYSSKHRNGLFKLQTRISSRGHYRVKLKSKEAGFSNGGKFFSIHRLVWETFMGEIPKGMVIDHINGNKGDNYLTNLQCISNSDNTSRAYKMVRPLVNNNYRAKTFTLKEIGNIKALIKQKPHKYGYYREIANKLGIPEKHHKRVSNMANGKVFSHIAVSKIKVLRKFENVICDMEVENAHSYITKSGFVSHNTTEMEFENGSMITSIPTTEDAGRSEAVSLLVIDEAAILRWASTIWAAAFPTLSCLGYKTPIFLETREEVKKGIFKPFIKQVEIGSICPKEKGVNDISHLGLRTLSHKGLWQNILFSQNKGKLETWEVKDCKGKTIKATPEHRFYTLKGWKTLREIIERNLHVIQVETGLDKLEIPPQTKKPKEQIIKPIKDFPNHYISNWGKVYRKNGDELVEILGRPNKDGYLRVGLTNGTKRNTGRESNVNKNKTFQLAIAKLVYQTFIGPIPFGYQIDHINCNKIDNYITNLRILTPTENVSRSSKYNLMAVLNPILGNKLPNLDKRGRILFLRKKGYSYNHIAKKIYPEALQGSKFVKRIFEERGSRVYISRLKLLNTTFEDIYDIHVENDNSFISANNYINHNTGGAAIVNSTPYGIGNWFHQMWVDACSSGTQFNPIRLYWDMHPERDGTWYHNMKQILGPRRTAQEIDGDFLTSGNSVFDLLDIKAIEDSLSEYLPIKLGLNGNLRIYEAPKKGVKYFLGADIASGRARDYSAFSIMKRDGEEVVCFKGKLPIEQFAKLVFDTAGDYNNALCAPEANDIGIGVIKLLQEWNYPNLYYSIQIIKEKNKKKPKKAKIPGWVTSVKNRHAMIMELESDIRNDVVVIKDPFFVQEAYTFIYNEMNKPIAMGKDKVKGDQGDELYDQVYTDDAILAKSITNFIRKGLVNSIIVAPK